MAFIISNYLSIHQQRAIKEHYDFIYAGEEFNTHTAGSKLLGIDVAALLSENKNTLEKITNIIKTEVEKEEESQLLNQIIETHINIDYALAFDCLANILKGIED